MTPEQIEEQRNKDEERLYGFPVKALISPEEEQRRRQVRLDFESVFLRTPRGESVLQELARMFHFSEPCMTEVDRILSNGFKDILVVLGKWGDSRSEADDLIHRIVSEVK